MGHEPRMKQIGKVSHGHELAWCACLGLRIIREGRGVNEKAKGMLVSPMQCRPHGAKVIPTWSARAHFCCLVLFFKCKSARGKEGLRHSLMKGENRDGSQRVKTFLRLPCFSTKCNILLEG